MNACEKGRKLEGTALDDGRVPPIAWASPGGGLPTNRRASRMTPVSR